MNILCRIALVATMTCASGYATAQGTLVAESGSATGTSTLALQVIATYGDMDLQINSELSQVADHKIGAL